MTNFLTVKEAAQVMGKSPSSIRRVIYPIIEDDNHADRGMIQPAPDDARTKRINGEVFAWQIAEELLRRVMPPETDAKRENAATTKATGEEGSSALITMLQRELDIKNEQIRQQADIINKQMELVSGLSERIREGNILMGTLQHRLAITDGRDSISNAPVDAKTMSVPKQDKADKPEKGSSTTAKPTSWTPG